MIPRRRRISAIRGLSVAALFAACTASGAAQSIEELAQRHLQARGGKAAIDALRTVRMRGTLTVQAGLASATQPILAELAPPEGKSRLEIGLGEARVVTIFDGTRGWQQGAGEPAQELAGDALASTAERADVAGPLGDLAKPGRTVERLADETLDSGRWLVLLVTEYGSASKLYLSPETFLVGLFQRLAPGEPGCREAASANAAPVPPARCRPPRVSMESKRSDFRPVAGVQFSRSLDGYQLAGTKGSPVAIWTRLDWEEIEVNVEIQPNRFDKPGGRAPTTSDRGLRSALPGRISGQDDIRRASPGSR